jgi:hypothetical protein
VALEGAAFAAKSGQRRLFCAHVAAVTPTSLHSLPTTAAATAATREAVALSPSAKPSKRGTLMEARTLRLKEDHGSAPRRKRLGDGPGGARSTGAPIKPK